jgi:hypothetical protein
VPGFLRGWHKESCFPCCEAFTTITTSCINHTLTRYDLRFDAFDYDHLHAFHQRSDWEQDGIRLPRPIGQQRHDRRRAGQVLCYLRSAVESPYSPSRKGTAAACNTVTHPYQQLVRSRTSRYDYFIIAFLHMSYFPIWTCLPSQQKHCCTSRCPQTTPWEATIPLHEDDRSRPTSYSMPQPRGRPTR